jgi:hypothetical protein
MKSYVWLLISMAVVLLLEPADANTVSMCTTVAGAISCTGTLGTPEDVFLETFTLASSSDVTVQTYGFGGGTNAAGDTIPSGGFDSLVALFSGPATDGAVLTDSTGNPIASADTLSSFSAGCPPAGTVAIGTIAGNCGDNTLTATLNPGTYTLLLSDANFVPLAVNPGVLTPFDLTDTTSNYTDFTGGVFQTCASATDCNTDTGNFAVDILGSPTAPSSVPEPANRALLGFTLAALAILNRAPAAHPETTASRALENFDSKNTGRVAHKQANSVNPENTYEI